MAGSDTQCPDPVLNAHATGFALHGLVCDGFARTPWEPNTVVREVEIEEVPGQVDARRMPLPRTEPLTIELCNSPRITPPPLQKPRLLASADTPCTLAKARSRNDQPSSATCRTKGQQQLRKGASKNREPPESCIGHLRSRTRVPRTCFAMVDPWRWPRSTGRFREPPPFWDGV